MAKTYRTAQGKSLDIEKLRLQNELTPAIGNMRVNARGDQLGPGGKIVKSREDMVNQHYQTNLSTKTKKNVAEADVIPTKGGKSKRVEKIEPSDIQLDIDSKPVVKKEELPVEDDFVDPEIKTTDTKLEAVIDTAEAVESTAKEPANSSSAASEKSIKGGLARAVAKTREYESKKNKPKRI